MFLYMYIAPKQGQTTPWGQNSYMNINLLSLVICCKFLPLNDFLTVFPIHAYQSLSCETAISAEFSELFSLKRIYVKYKNAILSLIDCFFRT